MMSLSPATDAHKTRTLIATTTNKELFRRRDENDQSDQSVEQISLMIMMMKTSMKMIGISAASHQQPSGSASPVLP